MRRPLQAHAVGVEAERLVDAEAGEADAERGELQRRQQPMTRRFQWTPMQSTPTARRSDSVAAARVERAAIRQMRRKHPKVH